MDKKWLLIVLLVGLLNPLPQLNAQVLDRPIIIRLGPANPDLPNLDEKLAQTAFAIEHRLRESGLWPNEFQVELMEDHILEIQTSLLYANQILPLLNNVGLLEFVDFSDLEFGSPIEGDCILSTAQQEQFEIAICEMGENAPEAHLLPNNKPFVTVIDGQGIVEASASPNKYHDTWQINLTFDEESAERLQEFTQDHIGEILAIVLDGEIVSMPIINQAVADEVIISGNFSQEEAEMLATMLRTKALPLPLQVLSVMAAP